MSREANRTARRVASRLGEEVRLARGTLALTLADVGRLARVSASTVRRVEDGDANVQLSTMAAVGGAVGLDLSGRFYPARAPSLRDTGQFEIADHLRTIAHPRWRPALEVVVDEHGRAADEVFFGTDEIIHAEIERRLNDFQAQLRAANVKREALAARHQRPVRRLLVIEDTERNRRIAAAHAHLIRAELPAGTRAILNAFRTGEPLGSDGLLWIRRSRIGRVELPAGDHHRGSR